MEFETRLINGKPSIFFKNDPQKPISKVNTKNFKAKKEIKKSMEISGEVDKVKPSPRQNEIQNDNQLNLIYNVLNQNGVKLSQNQIYSLLAQIQKNDKDSKNNIDETINIKNKPNKNDNDNDQEKDIKSDTNKSKWMLQKNEKFLHLEPTINSNQSEYHDNKILSDIEKTNGFKNRVSLIEKKRLKWLQDKELLEKLNEQENYDASKIVSSERIYQNNVSNIPKKENLNRIPFSNKLSLTEKKKLQWQKDRDELEKRDLEQRLLSHENTKYNIYPSDFRPEMKISSEKIDLLEKNNEKINNARNNFGGSIRNLELNNANQESLANLLRKSNSLNSLNNYQDNFLPIDLTQIGQENDRNEKKYPSLDNEDTKMYSPYEKNKKAKNSIKYSDRIEEFKRINEQIDQITAVEKKIRNSENNFQETKNKLDQSQVPPAMRTSIYFGGVMFDDEIKKTKELERKKWLQDLEEQKKEKFFESQLSTQQNQEDNLSAFNLNKTNVEEKSFARTRNLLDPAQIDELERRKKQGLQHKLEIEAQIAEKKRIKMIEEEIQNLNNMKIENEALEIKQANKLNEERKKQNSHFQNFEKILNSSRPSNTDVSPSVLQGEYNKHDQETRTMRSNITETRSQEIYRKMQEAELAAAEEKHKKLLKRLQKGGHDTSQLEKKFSELKARLTGNPEHLIRNTNTQMSNYNSDFKLKSIESNRINNNLSNMKERHNNEINVDTAHKHLANKNIQNKETECEDVKQIIKLLREKSAGLSAEIREEDLRLLLKNMEKTGNNFREKEKKSQIDKNLKTKMANDFEDERYKVGIGKDGKPIWNFKNPKGKKAISNSQKDPFYFKRAQEAEERKLKRVEYYKNFNIREKKKENNDNDIKSYRSDQSNVENFNQRLESPHENLRLHLAKNEIKTQNESIMNLLNKKKTLEDPIYEEDEDLYLNNNLNLKNQDLVNIDENYSQGYVPFMRTNEILDPIHACSPVPPSRESSATKRDREKARQAYIQNMRPSDYGFSYDRISSRNQIKDPLLNNSLVKNNPTPRQEQILNQLASLKQSLFNKQKEIASSIYNNSNENLN